jgi:hypothetical protein
MNINRLAALAFLPLALSACGGALEQAPDEQTADAGQESADAGCTAARPGRAPGSACLRLAPAVAP